MIENRSDTEAKPAVITGLNTYGMGEGARHRFDIGMRELRGLCEAAGLSVVTEISQNAAREDMATLIGSGKVEEIRSRLLLEESETGVLPLVVFNNTLSPSQLANLSRALETEVLDRTNLILNIFADRARTREARMQVDYAKLQYMLPRLVGLRSNLSRQGGTGGSMSNKGSGEKQIELDRRHIEKQMAELRRGLRDITENRSVQRKKRQHSGLPLVALVGYTNAGKSTIMNALLDYDARTSERPGGALPSGIPTGNAAGPEASAGQEPAPGHVLAKDMLFATLDTTVRRISDGVHRDFLLSDTVGFISDLPHDLVNAFRSTLEEALYADLIVEVVDYSDPEYEMQMEVTAQTLQELGAGSIPLIYAMNKSDLMTEGRCSDDTSDDSQGASGAGPEAVLLLPMLPVVQKDRVFLSARDGRGIPELLSLIDEKLHGDEFTCEMLIPYDAGGVLHVLHDRAQILSTEYGCEGIQVQVRLSRELIHRYKQYVL